MADVAFVLIIVVFFMFAGAFVAFCDRVIGPDEEVVTDAPEHQEPERVAA